MIYKMELIDSVDDMIFELLEVPIADKDITGIADNTTVDGNVFRDYLWLKKQWTQKWSIMCQDEYNRLRGFWTRQFGNAEVPFYRLFYGDNVYEDKTGYTVNGFVQINNDAVLYSPLSLTKLSGNATQETLSGKNLWSSEWEQGYINPTDGQSEPDNNNIRTKGYISVIPEQHYSITRSITTSYINVRGYDANKAYLGAGATVIELISGQGTSSATNPMVANATRCTIAPKAGVSYLRFNDNSNNLSTKYMMVLGDTTPTDYEPYCGGVPSPNPDYPQTVNVVSGGQEVAITGRNILDTSNPGDQSIAGMTATWNNGTVEVKGTNTATSFPLSNNISLPIILKAGTTITASVKESTVGRTVFRLLNTSGAWSSDAISIANGDTSATITLTEDIMAVQLYKGSVPTNTYKEFSISDWQIELGSTPNNFEPYIAPQTFKINLGKNLFDKDNANVLNAYFTANSGSQTLSVDNVGEKNKCVYIKCDPNTTYTVQKMEGKRFSLGWCSEQPIAGTSTVYGIVRDYTAKKITITTGDTAKYLIAYIINLNEAGEITLQQALDTLQIERGSVATSYAPYKTPIELAKIGTYQDYIWNDNGTWKIHKETGKVVLTGAQDEYWNYASGAHPRFEHGITGIKLVPSSGTVAPLFCNYYTPDSIGNIYNGADYKIGVHYSVEQIWVSNSDYTSANDFRTWLSTHNTTVYYVLATPTDTEITDSNLIAQLDFVASLYGGVNNIMLIPSAGEQGEINFKYRLNYEEETDIVPKTPVVLTLSDGGVINSCGCRENIQLIMRETTQGNSES